VGLVNK